MEHWLGAASVARRLVLAIVDLSAYLQLAMTGSFEPCSGTFLTLSNPSHHVLFDEAMVLDIACR